MNKVENKLMENKMKLKLFISYSHKDNEKNSFHIDNFKNHITPLKDKGLIEDWYDRELFAGEEHQKKIDNNLDDADIICLFISANFLSSNSCKKEKEKVLELQKKKGISIIPIILSPCGWLDDNEISKLIVLPKDGKPITDFQNQDDAFHDVYNELKKVINKEIMIRKLNITKEFNNNFLQDTEMLAKAHSQKENLSLDDIFVYPDLDKYDELKKFDKRISSKELIENILDYSKILIAGEDQSSKTTLCKILFIELRKKNFIPVYISDKGNKLIGRIDKIIERFFNKQYEDSSLDQYDKERIIPIIDDFHYTKYKEKQIKNLSKFPRFIIIVDDIFCLNFGDEMLVNSFNCFKINELKPSLRNELIRNWFIATDKKDSIYNYDNELYQNIDKTTELIDTSLGKIFGSGIMPAYPFYILTIVSSYETFNKPLNQEITSQGHCYQALIYLYLRKQNVKNEDIDTYINYLTELAFFIYAKKKYELTKPEFIKFMDFYVKTYNLPIDPNVLLKKLQRVRIITIDSFNNCFFTYPYLYYYFIGKYLSDHINEKKVLIKKIINNLHVNENAYIAIFLSHHSKNVLILDEITNNARNLFKGYPPSTLAKKELMFFDKQIDNIIDAVFPFTNKSPEQQRAKLLELKDQLEETKENKEDNNKSNGIDDLEIRRAIKTIEVMGQVIKNRAGSLKRKKLEEIFKEAMNVQLRVLSCFYDFIQDPVEQEELLNFISKRLSKIYKKNEKKVDNSILKEQSKKIYWNVCFLVFFGFIEKIIHSLGSNKLISIIEKIHNDIKTPASGLILHGILMSYTKNIQTDNIVRLLEKKNFSEIATRIMKLMIIIHCSLHKINYRDKQKIQNKLKISTRKLLINRDT